MAARRWVSVSGLETASTKPVSLFKPVTLVILTSDGVIEAMDATKTMFGFERLEQTIATRPTTNAQAMVDYLKDRVAQFIDGAEPHDDLTIVVLQV